MVCIIEEHWSENKNDSHQQDDTDCTYILQDRTGHISRIFSKLAEAMKFAKDAQN